MAGGISACNSHKWVFLKKLPRYTVEAGCSTFLVVTSPKHFVVLTRPNRPPYPMAPLYSNRSRIRRLSPSPDSPPLPCLSLHPKGSLPPAKPPRRAPPHSAANARRRELKNCCTACVPERRCPSLPFSNRVSSRIVTCKRRHALRARTASAPTANLTPSATRRMVIA